MIRKVAVIIICLLTVFPLAACGERTPFRSVTEASGGGYILTLHAFDGSYGALPFVPNMGHAFLSVENRSGEPAVVGNYPLSSGESVSVGIWGQTAHTGVWYNLESVYYDEGRYDTCRTLKKEIDAAQLAKLSEYIIGHDDWSFSYNCSTWSLGGWNLLSSGDGISVAGIPTPNALKKKINEFTESFGAARITGYGAAGYYKNGELVEFTLNK